MPTHNLLRDRTAAFHYDPGTATIRDHSGIIVADHIAPQYGTQLAAFARMLRALDECHTAFVTLNVCDGLTPQARASLRLAWALTQQAIIEALPDSGLARAIKSEPRTALNIEAKLAAAAELATATRAALAELEQWQKAKHPHPSNIEAAQAHLAKALENYTAT